MDAATPKTYISHRSIYDYFVDYVNVMTMPRKIMPHVKWQ